MDLSEEAKKREKKAIVEYYQRLREKQQSEGIYDPHMNGDIAPSDGHFDNSNPIEVRSVSPYEKYLNDPTLI